MAAESDQCGGCIFSVNGRIASAQRRQIYTRDFVEELLVTDESSENSSQEGDEKQAQKVLEDLLTQSLLDMEKRFTFYWQRFGHETDTKLRDVINRSEKRLNTRFYQEVQSGKRPRTCHAHRLALKNCFDKLERELYGTKLVEDLFISEIVTLSEKSSIKNAGTRRRQNSELLTCLAGRLTYEKFHDTFLPALSKDHPHLEDLLISELDQIEEEIEESKCVSCRTKQYVQVKRLAAPLRDMKAISLSMYSDLRNPSLANNTKWAELKHVVPDVQIIQALENKYPDFYKEFQEKKLESLECCCPGHESMVPEIERQVWGSEDENSEADTGITPMDFIEEGAEDDFFNFLNDDHEKEYKMSARPRGLCLIINNTDLPSTNIYEEKLEMTFKRLQFLVLTKNKLTSESMKKTLKQYSKKDHSKYDAFMCVIISRGNEIGVFGSDGDTVPLSELLTYFKASQCPSLAGKPKVFLIDASRGTQGKEVQRIEDKTFADDADFLIGHSTSEGNLSYRYRHGLKEIFIRKIIDTLNTSADQNDFLSCLTNTTRQVTKAKGKNSEGQVFKQVPSVTSTLTKKLHLTSDPLWPHPEKQ